MIDSLYIGATGMHAQQANVDTIANNLANVNTIGFKKSSVSFSDMMTRVGLGVANADENNQVVMPAQGLGVNVSAFNRILTEGDIKQTDAPLDVAIRGQGFFEVVMPDGTSAFTRNGSFHVNNDGLLATVEGYALKGAVRVPVAATQVTIKADGSVLATLPGQASQVDIGQIDLATFANGAALKAMGNTLFVAAEASGQPILGRPGEDGLGVLSQGFTESSNVKLVDEMVGLVMAQRAYEMNAKIIQASDEMLSISNNLRR